MMMGKEREDILLQRSIKIIVDNSLRGIGLYIGEKHPIMYIIVYTSSPLVFVLPLIGGLICLQV